ncbi:hypothetical protein R1sor_011220 [Riccia sorocarpa]|uniref:Reverse transcriptase n=1 Tax=Riccia sorocarpa TaxID=122646 RepID=A0ABD3I6A2_9MARC
MVDTYLAAAKTEGELYTRLAFCGERFDMANLDRFYLTNREEEELSQDAVQVLKSKEKVIKHHESREAKTLKIKSKDKWLREGEAPSRYFYLQLKAKFSREITRLERDNGDTITKHREIIMEVEDYYRQLYRRGTVSDQVLQARNKVVGNLTKIINSEEDDALKATPALNEVDEVVENLRSGKSPGLDGITADSTQMLEFC